MAFSYIPRRYTTFVFRFTARLSRNLVHNSCRINKRISPSSWQLRRVKDAVTANQEGLRHRPTRVVGVQQIYQQLWCCDNATPAHERESVALLARIVFHFM